jgi:hypothetical protein
MSTHSSAFNYWTGYKKINPAKYYFDDGDAVNYAPWATRQPSTGECSFTADGQWYSADCDSDRTFVCERNEPFGEWHFHNGATSYIWTYAAFIPNLWISWFLDFQVVKMVPSGEYSCIFSLQQTPSCYLLDFHDTSLADGAGKIISAWDMFTYYRPVLISDLVKWLVIELVKMTGIFLWSVLTNYFNLHMMNG